ncbi:MAG: hypothetical protein Q9211_001708 [Gyalolechia sp. 1 TL-2023]
MDDDWAEWAENCIPMRAPEPRHQSSGQPSAPSASPRLWIIASVVPVALLLLLRLFFQRDIYTDEADCLWILGPITGVEYFPLPYPIQRQHQAILDQLDLPEMFPRLLAARSVVRSTLNVTIEHLNGFINGEARRYSRFPSEGAETAFCNNTDAALGQLKRADSHLAEFIALYDLLKESYYVLAVNTAEAVVQGQITTRDIWWLFHRPSLLTKFGGYDANKAILGPVKERARKSSEAHEGLIAWQRDTERVDQIRQVFRGLSRALQSLANSLPRCKTIIYDQGNSLDSSAAKTTSNPDWLREWYRRSRAEHAQLIDEWKKLLRSVGNQEERLEIQIRPESCGRGKYASHSLGDGVFSSL